MEFMFSFQFDAGIYWNIGASHVKFCMETDHENIYKLWW
jgi:hypothetical protein